MQASLEAEARGKAEALRSKKKLEQDINELEVALDGANRGRADSEKNIKKLQQQIHEVQQVRTSSRVHTATQRNATQRDATNGGRAARMRHVYWFIICLMRRDEGLRGH